MSEHIPVLLKEVIEGLDLHAGDVVIDCNINRAGHSLEIAKKIGSAGTLIGIDLDIDALSEAQAKLAELPEHPRICLIYNNFRNLDQVLFDTSIEKADKILFDLGQSSQEIDISGRGFTFQKDEQLLMTYSSKVDEETLTAKDIVNLWSEETLADIIYHYSDEQFARRIAKGIVEGRKESPIETTFQLVEIIRKSVPIFYTKTRSHYATKTFQALRIAVNDEMEALKEGMQKAFECLKKEGRLAVITFHSLEDKIVKQYFKSLQDEGVAKLVNKKPIAPERDEVLQNPRSRSSKLRIITKI